MLNLSFFGASVTAQKTGYVSHFLNKAIADNQNFNISQHGYGSMHIKDAGMCFIDDVLTTNPNYCFIDWFSTGYIPKEQELYTYLDNFRYKFIQNNCQIIFLLLGGSDSHISNDRLVMYKQTMQYSQKHHIPYINIYEHVKHTEPLSLYRDTVHTLDFGSELYSHKIYKEFISNILYKENLNFNNLIRTKYSEIKKLKIHQKIIEHYIKIQGTGELIGMYQNVGPYSGIIKIEVNGNFYNENIWDRWCYYERKIIKIQKSFNDYINIVVSQEDFDKSVAKQQVSWDNKKILKPIDYLYYIGHIDNIEIQ